MNSFRLDVFLSVARNLSFTKASSELRISQPAISKHISEIEQRYGVRLFERKSGKITLTYEGKIFFEHAQQIAEKYRELEFEMNILAQRNTGKLIIGASTTIAQYLLPVIMSKFVAKFPDIQLFLITGNSSYIESLVKLSSVDIGIVEGASQKREFKQTLFAHDELVVVCSSHNRQKEEITLGELCDLPIVLRENGSGTLEVIEKFLVSNGLKLSLLNITMQLGSTEAIKRFIREGNNFAIVSIASIIDELKRNELKIVEIKDLRIERDFHFVTTLGSQNRLAEKFIKFSLSTYNKLL